MKTILIIEDNELSLNSFSLALESSGYQVFETTDGKKGIEIAQECHPDIILCDINLPTVDGWGVLDVIRKDPELARVQFVFMTGNVRSNSLRRGMERGADDYLEKPFGIDDLLACVEARLERAVVNSRIPEKVLQDLRESLRSNLPHELFTPLGGIMGLSEMWIADAQADAMNKEESLETMKYIHESAFRLHRTLRNYLIALDLSDEAMLKSTELISGKDIETALGDIADSVASRHRRKGDVTLEISEVSTELLLDEFNILIEELIDNACSFSEKNTPIKIALNSAGLLTIEDHGRGMTPHQLQQIGLFKQFNRKDYEQQGLGLGLYIIEKLTRRNKITYEIKSDLGKGTTVHLALPIA